MAWPFRLVASTQRAQRGHVEAGIGGALLEGVLGLDLDVLPSPSPQVVGDGAERLLGGGEEDQGEELQERLEHARAEIGFREWQELVARDHDPGRDLAASMSDSHSWIDSPRSPCSTISLPSRTAPNTRSSVSMCGVSAAIDRVAARRPHVREEAVEVLLSVLAEREAVLEPLLADPDEQLGRGHTPAAARVEGAPVEVPRAALTPVVLGEAREEVLLRLQHLLHGRRQERGDAGEQLLQRLLDVRAEVLLVLVVVVAGGGGADAVQELEGLSREERVLGLVVRGWELPDPVDLLRLHVMEALPPPGLRDRARVACPAIPPAPGAAGAPSGWYSYGPTSMPMPRTRSVPLDGDDQVALLCVRGEAPDLVQPLADGLRIRIDGLGRGDPPSPSSSSPGHVLQRRLVQAGVPAVDPELPRRWILDRDLPRLRPAETVTLDGNEPVREGVEPLRLRHPFRQDGDERFADPVEEVVPGGVELGVVADLLTVAEPQEVVHDGARLVAHQKQLVRDQRVEHGRQHPGLEAAAVVRLREPLARPVQRVRVVHDLRQEVEDRPADRRPVLRCDVPRALNQRPHVARHRRRDVRPRPAGAVGRGVAVGQELREHQVRHVLAGLARGQDLLEVGPAGLADLRVRGEVCRAVVGADDSCARTRPAGARVWPAGRRRASGRPCRSRGARRPRSPTAPAPCPGPHRP